MLTIDLAFEFANPLHRIASQAVLPKVADKMVEAFETRAREVYGGARR
jgi:coenzyme Q-binding protein COQ10